MEPEPTVHVEQPVVNYWDEPVRITKVQPSCTCTDAKLVDEQLGPKGRTTLSLSVYVADGGQPLPIGCMLESESGHRWWHRFTLLPYRPVLLDSQTQQIVVRDVYIGQRRSATTALAYYARGGQLSAFAAVVIRVDGTGVVLKTGQ